jgi:hypothetical protein
VAKEVKEKSAAEITLSDRTVKQFTNKIMERFENIESAKGTYMNRARKEREAMSVIYEGLAAQGVPQRVSKLHVKILRGVEQLKGWIEELEAEEQAIARKMAKAQGNKEQMSLFAALPVQKVAKAAVAAVAEKAKAKAKPTTEGSEEGTKAGETVTEAAPTKPKRDRSKKGSTPGVTGDDLAKADADAGNTDERSPMQMSDADYLPHGTRPN